MATVDTDAAPGYGQWANVASPETTMDAKRHGAY